ncbi:Serine/threonine-protein kinase CTR1 [Sesamum angolense]|uniref:Serine/threonine-protein kinase CTR1 n=1 Tax=Sesamum angolense TaxID=2727404 RepID=A0AAE1WUI8_9LAMI|nr:Serine/threonine-protein kinase CTR1 [Sesamum angolense]
MEEKTGKFLIGQQNNSGQVSYSYDDNRKDGPGSVSKMFSQDPSNSMDKILRPGEVNITVGARPVLNYSIQTGEEFALEFMWERVTPGNIIFQILLLELIVKLHLGIYMGKIQDAVNDGSQIEEKSICEPLQSIIRASSNNKSVHRLHSHSSLGSCGGPSKLLKLLCSFGGKILPRPSDRKLRYVGGETRILRISKDISWDELKQKTSAIYNEPHSIKYQLPGEDLDALVSVSSDEDLQNMMEEYNVLDDGGSQKLRMFLISNDDLDDSQLGLEGLEGDSDIQYVVAVNGMDFGSRRNSIGLDSHLGNNLDELLGLNVERRSGQIAASLPSGGTAHREVASTLPNQSSQIEIPSSSRAFEANSLGYQVQTISEQPEWHSSRASNQVDILPTKDEKIIVPSSVRFQYDYGSHHPLNHRPVAEKLVSNPILGQTVPHEALNVDQSYGSLNAKVPGVSGLELKLESKTVVQKKIESHKDHSPRRDNESSIRKVCDSTKLQPLDDGKAISSHPYDVSSLNNMKLEASAISATTDKGTLVLPKRVSEKNHEDVRDHVPPNIAQDEKMNKLDIVDHAYTSGAATMPLHSDSDVYTEDISYEPDIIPQRLFCSERVHREQAGLCRLSKSNNSSGPKLLMTHSRSDVSQHISESVDTSPDWDMTANLEKFNAAKSIYVGSGDTEEKLKESQKLTDDAAVISAMASSVCDKNEPSHKAELDAVVAPIAVTSGSSFPMKNQGTSEYPHNESPRTSMEFNHNKMNEKANEAKFMGRGEIPFAAAFQSKPRVVAASPEHGDILIDINDRFPHDFLSDIFSKAIIEESSAGVTPLHGDAAGLSVNLSNHEPKDWSFFQNFAQDDSRRDVSLMDQDHLTFSPSQAKFGEDVPIDYGYPPFEADAVTAVHAHSRTNLDAEIQRPLSPPVRPDTMHLHSDYDISQNVENLQFDRPMNSRTAVPDYEDAKKAAQPTGFPLVDFSVGEFDPSALQIIKNRDLEELRELGSGTYGTVYHAEFWHEAGILSKLHHPNVVAFYGVVQDGPGGTLATVTEYMVNGSLRHALISKDRHLDRRKRLIIAMDAAFGMEYLHSRNIVHFDLKCDNLLVNLKDPSRPICKKYIGYWWCPGTLPWMAPELLNGSSSKVSEKVDVFSFGIVLWEILTGEEPYANMHYGAIIGGIVNNTLRPPVPTFCDPEWRLLMEQCWAPDPLARPSFTEIAGRLRTMSAACSTKPQGFTAQNQLSK